MPSKLPRPPYDPELGNILTELGFTLRITEAHIEGIRQKTCPSADNAISGRRIEHEERTIPSRGGDLTVSIFRRVATTASAFSTGKPSPRPGIYYTHGGGMIAGNRFVGIGVILDWVTELDAVCVSVEYRLPPEHPDPAPIEDCYAALAWTSKNAPELGINPDILMIVGFVRGRGAGSRNNAAC